MFSRFMRYFVEVARLGSIRKASERLNVSASAIDRQILRAEAEFGMPLFERLPSGLRPTAAGELLLNSAGRWSRDFERVQAQMADLLGLRRGHVRIAVIDALAKGFMPRLVRDMRQEFPGVTLTSRSSTISRSSPVSCAPKSISASCSIRSRRKILRFAVIATSCSGSSPVPIHPLASTASCRFSRCVGQPIVAPAEPLALCEQVRALQAATGAAMTVAAASDNIQMMKSLVSEGVGIGILSSIDVMEEVRGGELAFIRIADAALKPLTLALCLGQARQLSSAANLFLSRVEQELGMD